MTPSVSGAARLFATILAFALLAAPASANDAAFTSRFAQTVHGDLSAVGNTVMTCPSSASCTTAQNGSTANNNDFTMARIDADGDASTFDSSSATVSLPAGSTVVWAGLYWAADTSAGSGGAGATTASAKNTVKLKVPGGAYQTVTAAAADVLTSTSQASRYRAFADVTSLVPAGGSGSYWVADLQAATGADRFGGWSLFVAYRDSAQALRRLNVFDGLGTVDATHAFTTTITPFHTPVIGPVTTKVGLLSFEGDAGLPTETATFNGHALSDGLNPVNNAMNSTIESGGTRFTAKTPDYANQLGMDLDTFTNGGALGNDQTSAALAFTSTNEYFMPSALYLVSDEAPPTSTGSGPSVGGTGQAGTTLTADPGAWNGTNPLDFDYQWQRCDATGHNCVDIPGATHTTYTPSAGDVGSTIRVIVTATNDAGTSAPATSAPSLVVVAAPPANGGSTGGTNATKGGGTTATTVDPHDGEMPASAVLGETSCQQLVGGAKYRRVALSGIGTVRVRAYTSGPALSSSPVRLTTEITGGRAGSVRYRLDGRPVGARVGKRHPATLTPRQLGKVGKHTLSTSVRGKGRRSRAVVLTLQTVPCQTLFTAQRWRTTAGAGLRLRIDSRSALKKLSFKVPSALLPNQTATARSAGFIRLYLGGRSTPLRYNLALPKRGAKAPLLGTDGKLTVTRVKTGVRVTNLPAGTAVAEITLYRVTKLDKSTPRRMFALKATVSRDASPVETFSAKPKAPR
jgi:hypothetical protein